MARVIYTQGDTFSDSRRGVHFEAHRIRIGTNEKGQPMEVFMGVAEVTDEKVLAFYAAHPSFKVEGWEPPKAPDEKADSKSDSKPPAKSKAK